MADRQVDIRARQAPLRQLYTDDPAAAPRTLRVRGGSSTLSDPLHAVVTPDSVPGAEFRSGAHVAVGGEGDAPCSADLLLAALAACQEVTLRMVAANMDIAIEEARGHGRGRLGPARHARHGARVPGRTDGSPRALQGRGLRRRARRARRTPPAQRRAVLRDPEHPARGRAGRVDHLARAALMLRCPAACSPAGCGSS